MINFIILKGTKNFFDKPFEGYLAWPIHLLTQLISNFHLR